MLEGGGRAPLVRVLGGVDAVTAEGSVIDVPSAAQRRLLGVLAIHAPRRLRGELLADVLGIGTGALRTTVARVRTTLGPDAVVTASTGYSLACDVDASRFCRALADAQGSRATLAALEGALALWSGPPLEEFSEEEWARGEVLRLTELHAGAVDDYAETLIAAHRAVDAVGLLESHIDQQPYRDRPRGLLIRALALAGRQADALRAFHAYRATLAEEVGTEPSPEVVRIERRVASGWNGIEHEHDAPAPADTLEIPLPAALARRVGLIGRTAERDVLRAELELVSAGGLRAVVVGGEPGIGKTTLLAEFASSVSSSGDATVLYGRCDETAAVLEPFRTVLGTCVEHAPLAVVADHVARCGGELARLCTQLSARIATAPLPTESDDVTARFLAFDAAADLLRRIASRRPLVLMIDDLQWAEPTALLLLRHLTTALADDPVLVVVSRRNPGAPASDDLRWALTALGRSDGRFLELGGLDESELAELVVAATRATPDADLRRLVARLREETAGNPLFASQLIRHWNEPRDPDRGQSASADPAGTAQFDAVPVGLRDVVWSRVRTLGHDVTEVLSAASVLGTDFPVDVLIDMVDLDERAVAEALNTATAAGLTVALRSVRRRMRFVHTLVAAALYGEVGPASRARLHERAAQALLQRDGEEGGDLVVHLARHSALAGRPDETLRWATAAGDHALAHLALTEAAREYAIAHEAAEALHRPEAERAELLVRLGDARHRAGDPDGFGTLAQAAYLAGRSGNTTALIAAALAADRGFVRLDSRASDYLGMVEAAASAATPGDVETRARLLALLAQTLVYTPAVERRIALAHEAWTLAEASGDPALIAHVGPPVLAALWTPGNGRQRREIAARAVAAAEASGDPRLQFSAHHAACNVAVESADPVMAARSLARLRATVRTVGEPRLRWTAGLFDTFEAMMAGRLAEAEALATSNLELGMQIGSPDAFTLFAAQYFVIGTFAGRHEELLPFVEQAMHENPGALPFRLAYGIVCSAVGRHAEARRILRSGMSTGFDALPVDNVWMTSVIGYAVLTIELKDGVAAAQLLPVIEPYAREVAFNGITSQGPIAAYVGKLASLLGRHDEAEEQLHAALDTATAFGWTYHRATTLFALAQTRHRAIGALDGDAQVWLAEASDLCRTGGFRSWIGPITELEAATRR